MATKRRFAALAAALLGTGFAASAEAQAPVPIGPGTDMTSRYGPVGPAGMPAPIGYPGGGLNGMPSAYGPGPGAPVGMMPGMMPPGMMPPGAAPYGMQGGPPLPPPGSIAPPGAPMPPGMPPAPCPPGGLGLPNNLQGEGNGNAYTPPLVDPDARETDPSRLYIGIEPFFLFHKGIRLPVTVTTGNAVLDPVPGALNEPTTQILHGGRSYDGGGFLGSNFRLAYNLLDQERLTIEASYFITEARSNAYGATSDPAGNPVLSRPYFSPVTQTFNVDPRAFPNVLAGNVYESVGSAYQGAQLNLKYNFTQNGKSAGQDLFFLAGPRWFRINERYDNQDTVTELPVGSGSTFAFQDRFNTINNFYGAQIGSEWIVRFGECLTMDVSLKGIFGVNHQIVNISGLTVLTDTTGALTGTAGQIAVDRQQGFYAQPSNIGSYSRDRFTWGPELGVKFDYAINDNVKLGVGYTLFYMDRIVRPGDQIDTTINVQPLFSGGGFGIARPAENIRETNWVTQSINFTVEFIF